MLARVWAHKVLVEHVKRLNEMSWHVLVNESYKAPNFCSLVMESGSIVKFMFSKKATKIDEIFIVDLTVRSK